MPNRVDTKATLTLAAVLWLTVATGACTNTYRVDSTAGESLILDAKERVIVTKQRDDGISVVCAEPYPDLGSATNVDASASGSATLPAALTGVPAPGSVQGEAQVAFSTVESLMALGTRTAGVNVLRDFAYRACEAYLNDAIDGEEYDIILLGSGYTIAAVMALDGMRSIDQEDTPKQMFNVVEKIADLAEAHMRLKKDTSSASASETGALPSKPVIAGAGPR